VWKTLLVAAVGWQIAALILARSKRLSVLTLLAMVEQDLLRTLREEAQKRKRRKGGPSE
jgi:hypothetical protein